MWLVSCSRWWARENLLDLAPYIADARALPLVLLGGFTRPEVEGHDGEVILSALGWFCYDQALGQTAKIGGLVVMVVSLARGSRPPSEPMGEVGGRAPRQLPFRSDVGLGHEILHPGPAQHIGDAVVSFVTRVFVERSLGDTPRGLVGCQRNLYAPGLRKL